MGKGLVLVLDFASGICLQRRALMRKLQGKHAVEQEAEQFAWM